MDPDDSPPAQHPDPGVAALTAAQEVLASSEPEPLLAWEADEYPHYEKSPTWYTVAGLIAIALIGIALVTESYLEAVVIALLAGVVYLYSHELPQKQEVVVNKLGVIVGDRFYPYSMIKCFWIVLTPDARTLNLETTTRFGQLITIQLGDTDPVLVRRVLSQELHEETGRSESIIDRVARAIRL